MGAINEETYWNDDVCRYEEVTAFPYLTEIELLRVFPEAKEIIRHKIGDWLKKRQKKG